MRDNKSSFLALIFSTLMIVSQCAFVQKKLVITWEKDAPNGQSRYMIKTNGQFPGPSLVFNENDDVEITVLNLMHQNTTIHWHGLQMQGTPWSDGVPGLSQKPIEPHESFVYRFKASPAGTHWYHSHSRTSMLDGLWGAIYIHPKLGTPKPWHMMTNSTSDILAMAKAAADPTLITLSDWSHLTSEEYMAAQVASGYDLFCVDSILVNGKGSVYCLGLNETIAQTSAYMAAIFHAYNGTVTDKGCFPFDFATEGKWWLAGNASALPPNFQSDCIPSVGPEAVIKVDNRDKWASLNFVCTSSFKAIKLAIDQHPMWVYEVDGHYIEPQLVDTIQMWAGERYGVMIKLDQKPGNYTIRVADQSLTQIISGFATLQYKDGTDIGSTVAYIDYGGQDLWPNGSRIITSYVRFATNNTLTTNVTTLNKLQMPPWPATAPAPTSDVTHVFYLEQINNAWQYTMNNQTMYPQDMDAYHPLLFNPNSPAANSNLVIRNKNGTWVDLVIQVAYSGARPDEFPHVLHKHSSKTWLIGTGEGIWNYSNTAEAIAAQPESFNLINPPYRDTFLTTFDGAMWIVMRYQANNPGAWLFHCHFEIHLAGGMAVAIIDGYDTWPTVPKEYLHMNNY